MIRTFVQYGVSVAPTIEGPQKESAPALTAFQVVQDADLILYDQKGIKVLPNTEEGNFVADIPLALKGIEALPETEEGEIIEGAIALSVPNTDIENIEKLIE